MNQADAQPTISKKNPGSVRYLFQVNDNNNDVLIDETEALQRISKITLGPSATYSNLVTTTTMTSRLIKLKLCQEYQRKKYGSSCSETSTKERFKETEKVDGVTNSAASEIIKLLFYY